MLIVDAFNVIHAAADLKGAPPAFKRLSVLGLASLISACPSPGGKGRAGGAVLVVDGTGGGLQSRLARESAESLAPGVRVAFAGPGREADALIEEMLEARIRGAGGGVLVISSDKRVRAAAKGARAQHLPSDVFLALLARSVGPNNRARRGGSAEQTIRDRDLPLDPESARWWMRFLEVDEDLPGVLDAGAQSPGAWEARSAPAQPTASERPKTPPSAPAAPDGRAAADDDEQESRWTDPLLLEALRVWGDRIRPGDLEMSRWLTDDTADTGRPLE